MNKATRTRSPGNSKAVIFFGALVLCIIVATISILQEKIYRGVSCDRDGGVDSSSSFSSKATQKARDGNAEQQEYIPASTEEYIMNHFEELGYNNTFENSKGCPIWETPEASTQENYDNLQAFLKDIYEYSNTMQKELDVDEPIPDFLKTMRREGHSINQTELCKAARPHPEGLQALFPSHQLSQTPSGYVEPLLTPMRHPEFCQEGGAYNAFRVDYIIHDFERMCLNLKPHSRAIFVDMGASLEFHVSQGVPPPIMSLLNSFEKNGFHFDHIYALESTKADPNDVYKKLLPEKFFPSYHWINTGVSSDPKDRLNPLRSIISKFEEDDLIIVKLDIDTSQIEVPLAKQLLEDDTINKLVDHFYFEHHVQIYEMKHAWDKSWVGSVQESFELMNGLRNKGVAAHFWV